MKSAAAVLLLLFQIAPAADEPVEKTKKNIKVLQGMPSSQLIPTMAFMANSLGVTCSYCHAAAWESDEKPEKHAARQMIALQRDINARFYQGKNVVTCNTCHRGSVATTAIPDIANAGWNPRLPPPAPPAAVEAEEGLTRLVKVPEGVKSRIVSGRVERYNGRTEPVSDSFTLTIDGTSIKYDTKLSHPPEATRALAVYLLNAPAPERVRGERWMFDDTGSLVRRMREIATPLGSVPEQIDYKDFRDVSGARLPFFAQWSRADYRVTYTVEKIE